MRKKSIFGVWSCQMAIGLDTGDFGPTTDFAFLKLIVYAPRRCATGAVFRNRAN